MNKLNILYAIKLTYHYASALELGKEKLKERTKCNNFVYPTFQVPNLNSLARLIMLYYYIS
jgi:hypothetical protein